ncbi:FxsA family protein [Acidothermaceae bacterium B102]|nr:FxsA family protein [Acidothermaceae bacterium B102]
MVGLLLLLLVAVPILEIYVIVQVGEAIGIWWTVFALIAETLVGGWLVRREGRRAWRTLVVQLSEGQAPTRTAIDGAVILVGGLLLLAPGFLTDFLGFLCVLPLTRPLVRRAVVGYVSRRSGAVTVAGQGGTVYEPMTRQNRPTDPRVIEGHVVDRSDDGQDS